MPVEPSAVGKRDGAEHDWADEQGLKVKRDVHQLKVAGNGSDGANHVCDCYGKFQQKNGERGALSKGGVL